MCCACRAAAAAAAHPIAVKPASPRPPWDMPIAGDWPSEVLLIDRWRGGGRSEGAFAELLEITTARSSSRSTASCAPDSRAPRSISPAPRHFRTPSRRWTGALWRRNPLAISKDSLRLELSRLNQWAPRRRLDGAIQLAHASVRFLWRIPCEGRHVPARLRRAGAAARVHRRAGCLAYTDFYLAIDRRRRRVRRKGRRHPQGVHGGPPTRGGLAGEADRIASRARFGGSSASSQPTSSIPIGLLHLQAAGVPRLLGGGFVSSAGLFPHPAEHTPPPSREEPPPKWRGGGAGRVYA